MTRIAGVADLHIGASHLTTLDDQEAALTHLVYELDRRSVRLLLIGGDLFHIDRPSPAAIAVAGRFLHRLALAGVPVVMSAGNHDPHASQIVSFFRGDITVPSRPEVLRFDEDLHVDVAVLPWLPDSVVRARLAGEASREEVAGALSAAAVDILRGLRAQRRLGVPLVLVAHATVAGSQTSTGWNMGYRPETQWLIPLEELWGFDLVIAGHIHRHQQPAPHVWVPGSLLPLDFSESQPHGFVVGAPGQGFEFVETPTPAVRTWDVPDGDVDAAELVRNASDYVDESMLVRVRLHLDEATAREYPPSRIERALLDAGAGKVQVELDIQREDRARDAEMTAELAPLTALGRYLLGRAELDEATRSTVTAAATDVAGEVLADREVAGVGELDVVRLEARDLIGLEHVDVDLEHVGLAVLQGPVGSGKSCIGADLLRFVLFGATRYGAKPSERVVRAGADMATAALELRDAAGHQYRVVRKVKRDGRGRASSTLDVLERTPRDDRWLSISTGKVEDGQAAIAKLLGGLSDRTLCAANVVLQRDADRFAAAPAEQRKDLLGEAAGLDLYGDLGLRTAKRLNGAERELEQLQAKADTLRSRADAALRLEAEQTDAERERDAAADSLARLDQEFLEATDACERAQERAGAHERAHLEAQANQEAIERIERQVADWQRKGVVAREILAEKHALTAAQEQLERRREDLAAARSGVETVQGLLTAGQAQSARRAREQTAIANVDRELATETEKRQGWRKTGLAMVGAHRQHLAGLEASGCLEKCQHAAGCTVATEAIETARKIEKLERDLEGSDEKGPRELDYERQLIQLRAALTLEPDVRGISVQLQQAKASVAEIEGDVVRLEKLTRAAEKIAAAERVVLDEQKAIAELEAEREPLRERRGALNLQLLALASARRDADLAAATRDGVTRELTAARASAQRAGERVAVLAGRLEELRAAAAELAVLGAAIGSGAREVAAWKELIVAWRACRVMTLETSVIPAVEDLANDVLRRFPYGLQLRLVTQRERKSGDGLAETLDIEVLGGTAPVYEGCSGGQRTAIDAALHVAIALVVSRRQTTRLRYLYLDEPEGLDAEGRAAFAQIARWASDELGMKVVVASHHEDLVDQLGGEVIRIEGERGAARIGASADEREVVTA